jgi:hypothetical protein
MPVVKNDPTLDLMKKAMRYLVWVNRFAAVLIALFILDYFLPYSESAETVTYVETYNVRVKRSSETYYYFETASGRELDIRFSAVPELLVGSNVNLWTSRIYGSLMKIEATPSSITKIAYRYGMSSIFAYVTLILAILAVVFKDRNTPFAFNASWVAIIVGSIALAFMLRH